MVVIQVMDQIANVLGNFFLQRNSKDKVHIILIYDQTLMYVYMYTYIWNFYLKIDFKIQTCLFT